MKYLVLLLVVIGLSCKKGNNCEDQLPHNLEVLATVIDGGSPTWDGCGWLLQVGDKRYRPVLLETSFQENLLQVEVRYRVKGTDYRCGRGGQPIPEIEIVSIKR